jgi:hypothetical protein
MRRLAWLVIATIVSAGTAGCSWEYWGDILYHSHGDGYTGDYSPNRHYDFQQRYEQQSRMAEEYYQE